MESQKLLLDVREVSRLLSVSPWTIRRFIPDGRLPSVRLGRRRMVEPAECQRLVELGRAAHELPEKKSRQCTERGMQRGIESTETRKKEEGTNR